MSGISRAINYVVDSVVKFLSSLSSFVIQTVLIVLGAGALLLLLYIGYSEYQKKKQRQDDEAPVTIQRVGLGVSMHNISTKEMDYMANMGDDDL